MLRIPSRWKLHLTFPLSALFLTTLLPTSILHSQQSTLSTTTSPDRGVPPSPGLMELQGIAWELDHPPCNDESCPIAPSGLHSSFSMADAISEVEPVDPSKMLSGLDASATCPLEVQRIPESLSVVGHSEFLESTGEAPEGKLTSAPVPQQEGSLDSNQAARGAEQGAGGAAVPSDPPYRLKEEYRSYDAPTPTAESSSIPEPKEKSSIPDIAEASDTPGNVAPPDDGAAPAPSEAIGKATAPQTPTAPQNEPRLTPSIPARDSTDPSMETALQKIAPMAETLSLENGSVGCAQPDPGTPPSPVARPVLRNRPASTILQKMRRLWERCTSGNLQTDGQIPALDKLPSIQNIHRLPMPWHYQLPASKIASLAWVEYPLTDRWHLTLPASLPGFRPASSANDPQSLARDADRSSQPSTSDLWNQTAKQFGQWLGSQIHRTRQWDRAENAPWLFYLWR